MGAPSLVSYSFPTDGARLGNTCDACNRGAGGGESAPIFRETSTSAIYCSETCAARHHPPMSPGYVAVAREALALGWPTSYRRDLTLWDRRELAARVEDGRSPPFLWICRDLGTHLVHPGPRVDGVSTATLLLAVIGTYEPTRTKLYYYEHGRLSSVTPDQARAIVDRWDRDAAATTTTQRRSA